MRAVESVSICHDKPGCDCKDVKHNGAKHIYTTIGRYYVLPKVHGKHGIISFLGSVDCVASLVTTDHVATIDAA